jgi:hypothetical protein
MKPMLFVMRFAGFWIVVEWWPDLRLSYMQSPGTVLTKDHRRHGGAGIWEEIK